MRVLFIRLIQSFAVFSVLFFISSTQSALFMNLIILILTWVCAAWVAGYFDRYRRIWFCIFFILLPVLLTSLFAASIDLTLKQGKFLAFKDGVITLFGLFYHVTYYGAFALMLVLIDLVNRRLAKRETRDDHGC